MAKFELETNKALKETGLSIEAVRTAIADGQTKLIARFRMALAKRVHPEAMKEILKQLGQKDKSIVCAEPQVSGDHRIDMALEESGISLPEAKALVMEHLSGKGLGEPDFSKYIHFTRVLRHRMSAQTAQDLLISWSTPSDGVVKTASCSWISKNCKLVRN